MTAQPALAGQRITRAEWIEDLATDAAVGIRRAGVTDEEFAEAVALLHAIGIEAAV